jgi:hypothetical protein
MSNEINNPFYKFYITIVTTTKWSQQRQDTTCTYNTEFSKEDFRDHLKTNMSDIIIVESCNIAIQDIIVKSCYIAIQDIIIKSCRIAILDIIVKSCYTIVTTTKWSQQRQDTTCTYNTEFSKEDFRDHLKIHITI